MNLSNNILVLFSIVLCTFSLAGFSPSLSTFQCSDLKFTNTDKELLFSFSPKTDTNQPYTANDVSFVLQATLKSYSVHNRKASEYTSQNGEYVVSASLNDVGNGVHNIGMTLRFAGSYSWSLFYKTSSSDQLDAVANSLNNPCSFTLAPGDVKSVFHFAGTPSTMACEPFKIPLVAYDVNENPVPMTSSNVVISSVSYIKEDENANKNGNRSVQVNLDLEGGAEKLVTISLMGQLTGAIKIEANAFNLPVFGSKGLEITVQVGQSMTSKATVENNDLVSFLKGRSTSDPVVTLRISERDKCGNLIIPGDETINKFILTMVDKDNAEKNVTIESSSGKALGDNFKKYHLIKAEVPMIGNFEFTIKRNGEKIDCDDSKIVAIGAGNMAAGKSVLSGVEQDSIFLANSELTLKISARDKFGNAGARIREEDFDLLDVAWVNIITGKSYNQILKPSMDVNEGTFSLTIKPSVPGNYTVQASYNQIALENSDKIKFSVYSVTTNSKQHGSGAETCTVGKTCRFVVVAYDDFGNIQFFQQDQIAVIFTKHDAASDIIISSIGRGSYAVQYVGQLSGNQEVKVLIPSVNRVLSTFTVPIEITETSKGILTGTALFSFICASAAVFFVYRQMHIRKVRAQWEQMKKSVYQEYNVNAINPASGSNSKSGTVKGTVKGNHSGPSSIVNKLSQFGEEDDEWIDQNDATAMNKAKKDALVQRDENVTLIKEWVSNDGLLQNAQK